MRSILFSVFVLITGITFGQNVEFEKDNFKDNKDGFKEAKDNLKSGDEFYEQGPVFYKDALPFYEKANAFNPNNALLNYKLGQCYLASIYKDKALPHLEKALQDRKSVV